MFQVEINDSLRAFLQCLYESKVLSQGEHETYLRDGSMPLESLIALYDANSSKTQLGIKQLLTPLNFTAKPKPAPGSSYSPEFKQHLDALRSKLDEQEYQKMVGNDHRDSNGALGYNETDEWISPAQMSKQIREQVTTVFNVLVSVASVVFAIWYWSKSSKRFPTHIRILLCLFFGLLVLIAEVVVYNGYLKKIDEAKGKERTKREERKVVKTIKLTTNTKRSRSVTSGKKNA
ncbi:Vph2p KNAG_0A06370 [Huiozyma naganishii CBS 8797]|uniref:Uncharacterized protein n=1 Tax=Huiozyma naganishii (strain ATCC MYA-139 / BCRC 22969 / CBS 8797 / KCTC 17520 / NBRC 10181 / NCYC 3082 / Yp74L-3) TaxID=1071383 RepID=J7S3Z6_HUIN7|nr:hypothetical protein KNAG_0A06370 [Kazachstania naganishii CBS 8797]CCK68296.1 hypothetical protein KNAG_0A06370 [Kazachstania naganishii CBS 8797]